MSTEMMSKLDGNRVVIYKAPPPQEKKQKKSTTIKPWQHRSSDHHWWLWQWKLQEVMWEPPNVPLHPLWEGTEVELRWSFMESWSTGVELDWVHRTFQSFFFFFFSFKARSVKAKLQYIQMEGNLCQLHYFFVAAVPTGHVFWTYIKQCPDCLWEMWH